jgi:hypothetical protein
METSGNKSLDEYVCKTCNKIYKNRSGLWKHMIKHEQNNVSNNSLKSNSNLSKNDLIVIHESSNQIETINELKISNINENTSEKEIKIIQETSKKYECKKCHKIFKFKQGKWKHEQKCNYIESKKDDETEINKIKNKMDELIKENIEMKKQILELINKNAKIHPKTLQKINKQLNNNGTIINNTFVKFGNLSYNGLLTDKQQREILNKQYLSLEESIKQIHFNKDFPEYSNIYITNMKDDIAYVFNGEKFISVRKNDMLTQLIDMHIDEINISFEKNKGKLREKYVDRLEQFLSDLNNSHTKFVDESNQRTYPNYKAYKVNAIKLLIYNESDAKKLSELSDGSIKLIEKNFYDIYV